MTPVFTLLLLWATGVGGAVSVPYFVLGTVLVVTANLLVLNPDLVPWVLERGRRILGGRGLRRLLVER